MLNDAINALTLYCVPLSDGQAVHTYNSIIVVTAIVLPTRRNWRINPRTYYLLIVWMIVYLFVRGWFVPDIRINIRTSLFLYLPVQPLDGGFNCFRFFPRKGNASTHIKTYR